MSLTRYALDTWCYLCDEPTKDAAKSDSGEWVPYEEAAALRARVAELEALLNEAHEFWSHYSRLNESGQDDISDETHAMLERMVQP